MAALALLGIVPAADLLPALAAPALAHDRPLWVRQLGTSQLDNANAVAVDASGNVVVAGFTGGPLGGANRGSSDAWAAKYDTDGNPVWIRQFGTYQGDSATAVAADGSDNVFVAGWTNQEDFYDAFLTKFNADGTRRWQRVLDSGSLDVAAGVATDGGGNVIVAGSTQGALAGPKRGYTDA